MIQGTEFSTRLRVHPSEGSDQHAWISLISFAGHSVSSQGSKAFLVDSRLISLHRLTCVFNGHSYNLVGNTVPQLKLPITFEPAHDRTNKMTCAPSEDSDQPGHPPSLIRVFAVHMKKAWILSYPLSTQLRL